MTQDYNFTSDTPGFFSGWLFNSNSLFFIAILCGQNYSRKTIHRKYQNWETLQLQSAHTGTGLQNPKGYVLRRKSTKYVHPLDVILWYSPSQRWYQPCTLTATHSSYILKGTVVLFINDSGSNSIQTQLLDEEGTPTWSFDLDECILLPITR